MGIRTPGKFLSEALVMTCRANQILLNINVGFAVFQAQAVNIEQSLLRTTFLID